MFKQLRSEAFAALSADGLGVAPSGSLSGGARVSAEHGGESKVAELAAEGERRVRCALVARVERTLLDLTRVLLDHEALAATDNLIDYGATSMTAMLLLGKLRGALEGTMEGNELHGLKLAIVKERLWGSTRDLARGLVGADARGRAWPADEALTGALVVEYCGG